MIIFITQLVPTWREENHYYSELHRIPIKINNYNEMKINAFPQYIKTLITILIILLSLTGFAQNGVYNVKDFGAKGDGKTLDTKPIQQAVNACFKDGGGEVFLPAGKYLVGCIILKSNINLNVGSGAVLLGSTNRSDYKIIVPDYESRTKNLYVNRSILYAENAENVSVTGNGIIDGQGTDKAFGVTRPQTNRPFLARFTGCRNLVIRDITMLESANWTCFLLGCNGVLIDGLKIKNTIRANRDGLDIDCCEDITVSNCRINSMDDAIVLKSTGPAITRNINITNCRVSSHASGIKFGTETTGGYENVTISNCIIKNIPVHSGLSMMIVDGGLMKNIAITNIVMDSVNIPFMIRLGNRARPYKTGLPTPGPGTIVNISISNVIATNAGQTSHITGLIKKKLENISFRNISVEFRNKYKGEPLAYNKIPLTETDYPSGQLYGKNLPAAAFYFRDIDGLKIDGLNVVVSEKDPRIATVFDRIDNLQFTNNRVKTVSAVPFFYLRNVNRCYVDNCSNYGNSTFLGVAEEKNCTEVFIHSDKLAPTQKALKSVAALPDKTFDEIVSYSNYIFAESETVKDISCTQLTTDAVAFKLKAKPGNLIKLILLNLSENPDNEILIKVNGIEYQSKVSAGDWGWNAVNVHEICNADEVYVEVYSVNNSSPVWVSKVLLQIVPTTD
jgi:hypothetical protein